MKLHSRTPLLTTLFLGLSTLTLIYDCLDEIKRTTGEVLDIDGVTGGFNFQAAWTTGTIAGEAMAEFSSAG